MKNSFNALELGHENYVVVASEQDIKDEGDYMLLLTKTFNESQGNFHKHKASITKTKPDHSIPRGDVEAGDMVGKRVADAKTNHAHNL